MIYYFGYGSNIDATSLRAKGVSPAFSRKAYLKGYRLAFNVAHFFSFEGGMGNIIPTGAQSDEVLGMLHGCSDEDLAALDQAEAYGLGYDRIEITVQTEKGEERAIAYVGLPDFIDDARQPTERYLNIILRGARSAGFDPAYIAKLDALDRLDWPDLPPFDPPQTGRSFTQEDITGSNRYAVVLGHVFDLAGLPERLAFLKPWFAGKDNTLFLLNRADVSQGTDTLQDILSGRITEAQKAYLNRNLHAFAEDYTYAGRFNYAQVPAHDSNQKDSTGGETT